MIFEFDYEKFILIKFHEISQSVFAISENEEKASNSGHLFSR